MEQSKSKLPFLIVGIVVILLGGGLATWMVMRKKKDLDLGPSNKDKPTPTLTGRQNTSGLYTAEQLAHTALTGSSKNNSNLQSNTNSNTPKPKAVWVESEEGKRLVEERIKIIQMNIDDSRSFLVIWE